MLLEVGCTSMQMLQTPSIWRNAEWRVVHAHSGAGMRTHTHTRVACVCASRPLACRSGRSAAARDLNLERSTLIAPPRILVLYTMLPSNKYTSEAALSSSANGGLLLDVGRPSSVTAAILYPRISSSNPHTFS